MQGYNYYSSHPYYSYGQQQQPQQSYYPSQYQQAPPPTTPYQYPAAYAPQYPGTPYAPPAAEQTPAQPTYPMPGQSAPPRRYPSQAAPQPYPPAMANHGAGQTPMPNGSAALPAQSTMKRKKKHRVPEAVDDAGYPQPQPQPQTQAQLRPRSNSMKRAKEPYRAQFQSYHVFVTFHGTDELRIEFLSQPAIVEIREVLIRKHWPPGLESCVHPSYQARIKLRGSPWDPSGVHLTHAWDLIINLFTLFLRRGYSLQTVVNVGRSSPRYVFVTCPTDGITTFFLAYFSARRRKVTLIQAPEIMRRLRELLGFYFPEKSVDESLSIDNLLSYELKSKTEITQRWNGTSSGTVDAAEFLLFVIRAINDLGYQVETTLQMARPLSLGKIGLGSRMELYVFKGVPEDRSKEVFQQAFRDER